MLEQEVAGIPHRPARIAADLGLAFRKPARISAKGDPNRIVCVIDAPPGSLLVRNRICRTRAEWITLRRQTREAVERVQSFKQTG